MIKTKKYQINSLLVAVLFFPATMVFGQNVGAELVAVTPLKTTSFFGVDKYGSQYSGDQNTLYKKTTEKTYRYSALQLGELTSVDILNPLKIVVFYKEMNTVVLLDDKLSEISRVDFNNASYYRAVDFATEAHQNNLWVFNADAHELELFDYKKKKVIAHTHPVDGSILQQVSNFNYCWLLTGTKIMRYNTYGSFMEERLVDNVTDIAVSGRYLLQRHNGKFDLLNTHTKRHYTVDLPLQIAVKGFYLMDQNLYIYDGESLYHYHLNFPN